MKKILVFLFVVYLLVAFALSCFAYDSFTYDFREATSDDNTYILAGAEFPTSGNFVVTFTIWGNQTTYTGVTTATVVPTVDGDFLAYQMPVTFNIDVDGTDLVIIGGIVFLPETTAENFDMLEGVYFAFEEPNNFAGRVDFLVSLDRIVNPDFVESTNSGLGSIITWVGSLVTSFISGPLYPLMILMMLGISVTVLLLCYRVIKKITWG